MRIINGKKFYKADMDRAVRIDGDGWDRNDGRNKQWYSLFYDKESGFVSLVADNSGDCYGDYSTHYFSSPKAFVNYCNDCEHDGADEVARLLGDIDEDNEDVMDFVEKAF